MSNPPRFARRMADGAHASARTPGATGAGAATDAVCGIRMAAAEREVVITGSFVRRPVARFVLRRYGRLPAADSVQTKTGGASDRPVSEAIPSRRPAPGGVVLRRRLGTRLPFRTPTVIVPLALRQGVRRRRCVPARRGTRLQPTG